MVDLKDLTHSQSHACAPPVTDEPAMVYMPDPYGAAEDAAARARWMERAKILHGPFKPGGVTKVLGPANRTLLPEIMYRVIFILIS